MVLLLTDQAAGSLLTTGECINLMEDTYRQFGKGIAQNVPRSRTRFYPPYADPGYLFSCMIGGVPKFGTLAMRIYSVRTGLKEGKVLHHIGNRSLGVVFLFDLNTSELLAIMPEFTMSPMRVAAVSALGTRYLARKDSDTVGLFGSGKMAIRHLEALCAIRKVKKVNVYSPTRAHRETFSREMSKQLGIDVNPVEEPIEAVKGVDIICAATSATKPVFDGRSIEPGTHVVCIVGDNPMSGFGLNATRHEFDERTIKKSDVIVLNSKIQSKMDKQILWRAHKSGIINFRSVHELSELVLGKFRGRTNDEQITLYHNNCGMGIQWPGPATTVYRRAKAKGIGKKIPHDWFTTSIEKWIERGYHPST